MPGPATSTTLAEFKRSLVESGLVEGSELEKLAAGAPGGVLELARALIRSGKLTPYQAAAVNQGKAKGLVIGNYFVLDKLGEGGMGVVFKAKHRRLGRVVALKILPPSFARDRDLVLRFRREVDAAARLEHPNVIAAVDADEDRGVHFLAMDYVDGRDLERLVAERGPLPVGQALDCVIQAARGLDAAHSAGIIHRDIKPGNLMLDRSGTVRVLDLGLARFVEAASPFGKSTGPALTRSGSYMGTVDYMAPEQAEDSRNVDGRADIYGLGCTLYYLLTGRPPFEAANVLKKLMAHQERPAPSLRAARPEVPEVLEDVYRAMMAKAPGDRPASMAEVVRRLEASRLGTEAGKARADLKGFAEVALKRASPKTSKGRDASIFARPDEPSGLQLGNDLGFEDLVMDLREEFHPDPLVVEDDTPLRRIKGVSTRPRRRSKAGLGKAPVALGAFAVLGLAVAVFLIRGKGREDKGGEVARVEPPPAPPKAAVAVAASVPSVRPVQPATKPRGGLAEAPVDRTRQGGKAPARDTSTVDPRVLERESWALALEEKWVEAVDLLERAIARAPDEALRVDWLRELGHYHLAGGDFAAYREVSGRAIERFWRMSADDPDRANNVAWMAGPLPDVPHLAEALRMAKFALDERRTYLQMNTYGCLLYRKGDLAGARKYLDMSIKAKKGVGDAFDWAFLSMAKHRLSKPGAREDLDRAVELRKGVQGWWNTGELDPVLAEAERVLRGPPKP